MHMRTVLILASAVLAVGLIAAPPARADVEDPEKGWPEVPEDPAPPPPKTSKPPRKSEQGTDGRRRSEDGEHRHDDELDDGWDPDADRPEFPRVGGDFRYWHAKYTGKAEAERGGTGTQVELDDDEFELDRHGPGFNLRGFVELDRAWIFEAEYGRLYFDGHTGSLGQGFRFDGVVFPSGIPLETTVEVQMATFQANYRFYNSGRVKLGFPFGIGWYSQRVAFQDPTSLSHADDRLDAWSPLLGLSFGAEIGKGFGIESQMRFFGFAWGEDDDYIAFGMFDFEATVYWAPSPHFKALVGFRYVSVEHDEEDRSDGDKTSDFEFPAFVAGVALTF